MEILNCNHMTQLTIVDQVKEVEIKSGIQFELDITKVTDLAERGKAVTSVNDENFLAIKKEMQQTRKYVTEYFFGARTEFNKLAKGVIEVEKIVLAEFTPQEDRIIALDKAEKERLLKEARLEALPFKRERVTTAGIEFTDDEVLAMDDASFELEFAIRLAAKAEADRLAAEAKLAEERAAFEADKAELVRKQAEADAIEAARLEERERAAKELQLAKETAEREKKEAEERRITEEQDRLDRIEREKKEAELIAEKAEVERLKVEQGRLINEKYQTFLKKNNYNDQTDIIIDGVNLYRFIAKFEA